MPKVVTLQYLTEEGLAVLKQSFTNHLPEYIAGNQQFFLDYFDKNNYLADSAYTVTDFTDDLVYFKNSDEDDLHNIKVIYEVMKNIPTYIMMDDRFWAGLNHTIMWDYIMKRRAGEAFGDGIQNQSDKIYNSFFTHTKHGMKRGTYVNCVSRLWWAGKLTYDEDSSDHYLLTEELCKKGFASTIILFSSSNIMGRKEARFALLKMIKKFREAGNDVKRDDIVAGIRYLNLVAGSSLIDTMSYQDLEDMLEHFYTKYYS